MSDSSYHRLVPRKPVPASTQISLSPRNDSLSKTEDESRDSRVKVSGWQRSVFSQRVSVFRIWGFVIACCLIITGMILSIAIVLHSRQGQPLPNLPYRISVNTLVSVLATIMRGCILVALAEGLGQLKWLYFTKRRPLQHFLAYDLASRGPLGCIRLIFTLRGRSLVATLGALLMILSIALDSFTQQLVHYYPCPVPANNGSLATIPRASIYAEYGPHQSAALFQVSTGQISSIIGPTFNPNAISIPFTCSTGNCKFDDEYATISYCTECADVTDELQTFWDNKTVLYNANGGQGTSYTTFANGTIEYDNGTIVYANGTRINQGPLWENVTDLSLNTTLPSGLWTSWTGGSNDRYFSMLAYTDAGPNVTGTFTPGTSASVTIEMILGNFGHFQPGESYAGFFGSGCVTEQDNQTWGCLGQGAARCKIQPCVQAYNASVNAGMLSQSGPVQYTDWGVGTPPERIAPVWVMADMSCISEEGKQSLKERGLDVSQSRFIPYDVGVESSDGNLTQLCPGAYGTCAFNHTLSAEERSIVPPECIYQIDSLGYSAMQTFLTSFFTTYAYTSVNTDTLMGDPQALVMLKNTYIGLETVNQTLQAVAEGLSIRMRQWDWGKTGRYSKPAVGAAYMTTTCVSIRWPWLIYPASLAALTLIFFIATLLCTETAAESTAFARGWKNSPLPLIYHGVDGVKEEGKLDDAKGPDDIFAMERLAKNATGFIAHGGSQRAEEVH